MSWRLTDAELDALLFRFSPGRHPKVAAALAELLEFRSGERQRAMDELLNLVETYMAEEIAKLAAAKLAAKPEGLLEKYIRHVGDCEGVDFLHDNHRPRDGRRKPATVTFTDEEWAELRKISGSYE